MNSSTIKKLWQNSDEGLKSDFEKVLRENAMRCSSDFVCMQSRVIFLEQRLNLLLGTMGLLLDNLSEKEKE